MTAARTVLLAGVVQPRRLVGSQREHAAYENFCSHHHLTPSAQAVTLYLTSLWDSGQVHGRGLRYRLHLLDLHARLAGEAVPSQDQDLRRYLRGLHREASLALPERGVDPLHVELLHAVLDVLTRPQRQQVRDAALLLLANSTGLPTQVLSELRWDQVRFLRGSVQITVPPMARRGPRTHSQLTVAATSAPCCVRQALLRWRQQAGPAQQPVFSLNGRSCDVGEIRPVLALLGGAPSRPGSARPRLGGKRLNVVVAQVLAPRPRAVRDRALLLLAFTAALGTDEARRLLQVDVVTTDSGLRLVTGQVGQRAVPVVLELHPPFAARGRPEVGMAARQGLQLRLLISADHIVVVGEVLAVPDPLVEVENSAGLGRELRVSREDPRPVAPRLDRVLGQPPTHGGRRHGRDAALLDGLASQLRRVPPAQRHLPLLRRLTRHRLDLGHDLVTEGRRSPAALAISQPGQSLPAETLTPLADHIDVHVEPLRDDRVRQPVGGQQHDLGPDDPGMRGGIAPRPRLEHPAVGFGQHHDMRRRPGQRSLRRRTEDHEGSALPLAETTELTPV